MTAWRSAMAGVAVALAAGLAGGLSGCATKGANDGPRPPQGVGPGGINFGHWQRDAEGAVDVEFRSFITSRYRNADFAKARPALEKDGFTCKDYPEGSKTAEGKPQPFLDCLRFYQLNDDVNQWKVEFWTGDTYPKVHYSRTRLRDPFHEEKKPKGKPKGK